MKFDVVLPWPAKELNPNFRGHWGTLAKAKRNFRRRCAWLAKGQSLPSFKDDPQLGAILACTFYPPDKRARDLDNVLAAMKSGLDGLADAIGIDDKHWALSLQWGEPVKGGAVSINVRVYRRDT